MIIIYSLPCRDLNPEQLAISGYGGYVLVGLVSGCIWSRWHTNVPPRHRASAQPTCNGKTRKHTQNISNLLKYILIWILDRLWIWISHCDPEVKVNNICCDIFFTIDTLFTLIAPLLWIYPDFSQFRQDTTKLCIYISLICKRKFTVEIHCETHLHKGPFKNLFYTLPNQVNNIPFRHLIKNCSFECSFLLPFRYEFGEIWNNLYFGHLRYKLVNLKV